MQKKGFVNNSIWIIVGKIAQMLLTLIIGSISARYLGPSDYGLINYGASYTAFFTPFITLGLYGIIVNEIVKNPQNDGVIMGSTVVMRILASVLSSVCIIAIVWVLNPGYKLLIVVTALQCISVMFQWADAFNYWCQARMDSQKAVLIQLFSYVATSGYKIYLLATGKSVEWFAFSMGLDYILQAICYVWCFRKLGNSKLKFEFKVAKNLLKNSYHYIFASLASVVYSQIDRIMLGFMLNTTVVGWYTAAYTISSLWTFILTAIIDSIRPVIMRTHQTDKVLYKKRIVQLYSAIIYLSLFVSVGMCIFSKLLIYIVYGKDYYAAIPTVCILTWSVMFSYLGVARSIWCVCETKQKYEKYLSIAGAIANVMLNAVLIPIWGMNGAAIATLLTQIITNLLVPFGIKEMRENSISIIKAFDIRNILNKKILSELKG